MRKIFGVLLLVLSSILTIPPIILTIKLINFIIIFSGMHDGLPVGSLLVYVIALLLSLVLACAFGFLGYRLITKSKPTVITIANDEDFPSRLTPNNKELTNL
jgi:hypothetical protein